MMRLDPSIVIKRMVIAKSAGTVYDEIFHDGVNIIRGENSSGKSTVLDCIFYGLGGDVTEWSEMALLCDSVKIELCINGKFLTISRRISDTHGQPMDIFAGKYEDALIAPASSWERYPYKRSQNKESFSQVLFRLLDMPDAANDDTGNITIHQIMRLLYADQLSPVDSLFRFERFDSAGTREAVGKLLSGAFNNEMYSNEVEIKDVNKHYDSVASELKSLYRALGHAGHDLTLAWVAEQRARVEMDRRAIGDQIVTIQRTMLSEDSRGPSLAAQELSYDELVHKQKALAELQKKKDDLSFSVADSQAFMESLQSKLDALKDSSLTAQSVGVAHFGACPACYAVLSEPEHGVCALCKEFFDAEQSGERIISLINDTAQQLRQSKLLQEHRRARLSEAESALEDARSDWDASARKYAEVQRRPTSEAEHKLSELHKSLGYFDRREEDLSEKAKFIEVIESLTARKSELYFKLEALKSRNSDLDKMHKQRLDEAYNAIAVEITQLLMNDLKREDSFEDPREIQFDFSTNRLSIDGQTYFSASSRAILKSSFFLGFHAAATKNEFFRHPRFCILDTIEDKGMEPTRSQNFQREIVRVSSESVVKNQIIFATAMIADDLDNEKYTVGRFYTRDERTLNFK